MANRLSLKPRIGATERFSPVAMLRRLVHDARGNIFMLMGFAILPLIVATGVGIDYSQAARLRTKINAAADAAALSAVSKPMMAVTDTNAVKTKAQNVFNAQATGLAGLLAAPAVTVDVATSGVGNLTRTVTVTWTADSLNSFGGILGRDAIPIGGKSVSTATVAPNIDFYVLLDTSPSMLIPTTTADIATLVNATKSSSHPDGCAFACHQTDVSAGNTDTVVDGGVRKDYYSYARAHGLSLRIDRAKDAIGDLTDVAQTYATQNSATYRMALATFDWQYQNLVASPGALSAVKTAAPNAQAVTYCTNNQRICGVGDNDQGTKTAIGFNGANTNIATPGNGSRVGGDKPQATLFIITDGMRDESRPGGKPEGPISQTECTAIKARGVKIAILYTEYLWESANDSWSVTNVRTPYLDSPEKISPALTTCASPGLMYKVTTDEDISTALAALFKKAIESARLSQ